MDKIDILREKMDKLRERIDALREILHDAIDGGNSIEALRISQELDIEIVKYVKGSIHLPGCPQISMTDE
jgi:hypothetical protein